MLKNIAYTFLLSVAALNTKGSRNKQIASGFAVAVFSVVLALAANLLQDKKYIRFALQFAVILASLAAVYFLVAEKELNKYTIALMVVLAIADLGIAYFDQKNITNFWKNK